MERAVTVTFILIILLATIAFENSIVVEGEKQDTTFVIQISVTLANSSNGTKTWNLTEDRTVNLFMNNTWQTVQLISSSLPLETMTVDQDGNPIGFLQFPQSELKPGENISYTITYRALSKPRSLPNITEDESETLEKIPDELKASYSGAEGPWLVNDQELQELAHTIAENETKVLTIIKKFITWIRDNINYTINGLLPHYPNQTYAERKGDCDDQANLFITLCRIYGIPSLLQIGGIYLPAERTNKTFWEEHLTLDYERIGWHGWAMVYVPPWGWLPVDLTYVAGGLRDPLNAINQAAVVTFQEVIQYVNVTETDYIASYRRKKDFLQNNDFYVHERNEMAQEVSQGDSGKEIVDMWLEGALIATVVVTVAVVGIFLHVRKLKKEIKRG
ncbi:MAG: transglutaminase domain-containing protein [Candidatus Bathyarchaeota archaeon]|nr:MAG: transglutaminase domain-containing protein [Candidatus Bathyarchaeota archaeon]